MTQSSPALALPCRPACPPRAQSAHGAGGAEPCPQSAGRPGQSAQPLQLAPRPPAQARAGSALLAVTRAGSVRFENLRLCHCGKEETLHCPLPWCCTLPTTALFLWAQLSSLILPLPPGTDLTLCSHQGTAPSTWHCPVPHHCPLLLDTDFCAPSSWYKGQFFLRTSLPSGMLAPLLYYLPPFWALPHP